MTGVAPRPRRRVLYIQQPPGGGSAASLRDTITALDKDRFEPVVLCYHSGEAVDRYRDAGAAVRVLGATEDQVVHPLPQPLTAVAGGFRRRHGVKAINRLLRRDLPLARHIASAIRDADPDLVHHNDNPRGDRASILAASWIGLPQVGHVRFMPRYFRPLDRTLVRLVDRFIFVSEAVQQHFVAELDRKNEVDRVLYNPFDLSRFQDVTEVSRRRVRAELGLEPGTTVVSSFGRLVEWKGQDVFLRAVERLATARPTLRALIVGEAPRSGAGPTFAERLRSLAGDLGIAHKVIFTGLRPDVPELMAASDVVVHSSIRPEPFGRVIVEAMAAGRPVVATDAGGVPEIVQDGRTGRLVPPGDDRAMSEAIEWFLSDTARSRSVAKRGRDRVGARFTLERFADELHKVYDATLAERRGGR